MEADALNAFLAEAFPNSASGTRGRVVSAEPGRIVARQEPIETMLRPGGLISGPTQMGLADMAASAPVLAPHGPVAMAVTGAPQQHYLRTSPPTPLPPPPPLLP